jgi:DNA-binding response OmpR family regulator
VTQRILVVDDDRQIVRLVQSYLEQAGYVVLTAADGATALRTIRSERPDLVVLDLMLPDTDGWAITRTVRSDASLAGLPIVMLTARVEDTDKIVGLELGADDYIAKPFNPRELLARVRAVLRRGGGAPAQLRMIELGALRLDLDRHAVTRDGQALDVTPTEFDLLKVLMQYPGHAFTRAELIEKGLGYTYDGLDRGIDSHIKNLRKKIEPDPVNPIYIQTVYGVGYRLSVG